MTEKERKILSLPDGGEKSAVELKRLLKISAQELVNAITLLSFEHPIYEYRQKGEGVVYGMLKP